MDDLNLEDGGAVWKKEDKNGNVYYSIKLGSLNFNVFKNIQKKSDRSPDYTIRCSGAQPNQNQSAGNQYQNQQQNNNQNAQGWTQGNPQQQNQQQNNQLPQGGYDKDVPF